MPIIRRTFPSDTVNASDDRPQKAKPVRPPIVVTKKAIIKPSGKLKVAKRWPHSDEQYVTVEKGVVSIRTPKECTKWPHDFRLRIIRDYKAPRTLSDKAVLARTYDTGTVYQVGGKELLFRQTFEELQNAPNKIIILRNEIVDLADNKAMALEHPDPAMRVLMVYAFIRRMSFNGVASFSVYDWQPT